MTNPKKIEKLTPEQEALIPIIRDEWIKIGLDTSPTDKQKAEDAIRLVYECAELKPPQQILWFDNPLAAVTWIAYNLDNVGRFVKDILWLDLTKIIDAAIDAVVYPALIKIVKSDIFNDIDTIHPAVSPVHQAFFEVWYVMDEAVWKQSVQYRIEDYANGISEVPDLAFYAYLDTIGINCSKLKGWWATAKHCGWWWAFKDVAVVTPKPTAIRLDSNGDLHSEGMPAVAYEGFNVYAYHGVFLPEKYGQIHPSQWRSEWLLTEENAEIKRVLIQAIGYDRICQELKLSKLDSWQKYELLEIDSDVDVEPIHLLKMTCSSTNRIHALRVPPDIKSAREAIRWVNWGIDPEEFGVQT